MELNIVQQITVYALPVVFAITLHEAAHGYVAKHFGDTTAYMLGRVSLNPLRHIDPVGTVLIPLLTMFLGGILFGWAKPVPVNFGYLRNPKKDMLWVALAGPAANLAMALGWAVVMKLGNMMAGNPFSLPMALMGMAGININVVLMVLNLLPLPPLDGGRIAVSLLPNWLAYQYSQVEPYGMVILVVLMFSGVLGTIMWPLINVTKSLILLLFGI